MNFTRQVESIVSARHLSVREEQPYVLVGSQHHEGAFGAMAPEPQTRALLAVRRRTAAAVLCRPPLAPTAASIRSKRNRPREVLGSCVKRGVTGRATSFLYRPPILRFVRPRPALMAQRRRAVVIGLRFRSTLRKVRVGLTVAVLPLLRSTAVSRCAACENPFQSDTAVFMVPCASGRTGRKT
jgi:hypothetical protein